MLLKLEADYSVYEESKRELKGLPALEHFRHNEKQLQWPRSPWFPTNGTQNNMPSIFGDFRRRRRLFKLYPYGGIPLEKRAWAALSVYRHKKWKLLQKRKRSVRSPSSGQTLGLTFALPGHLLSPRNRFSYSADQLALVIPISRRLKKTKSRSNSKLLNPEMRLFKWWKGVRFYSLDTKRRIPRPPSFSSKRKKKDR